LPHFKVLKLKRIIIASNNAKKRKEIEIILATLGIEVVPAEGTAFVEVVEDADSFAGNARKKAEAFAAANHLPALADDSGLCVDALKGAPGIFSSRYAGEGASDAENNVKLLDALEGEDNRQAYFMCALHVAFPDDAFSDDTRALTSEGRVNGNILQQAVGETGFGYDPLFFCPELGKAFANATADEKASVSHRGRALRLLVDKLKKY